MNVEEWVLYYPKSVITDTDFLRQCILYFDGIGTVVPDDSDRFHYSAEMEFLTCEGMYRPYYSRLLVHEEKNKEAADLFWDEYLNLITGVASEIDIPASENTSYWPVYPSDIKRDWLEQLQAAGIASKKDKGDEFVTMKPHFVLSYLALASKYLSILSGTYTVPYTDFTQYHKFAIGEDSLRQRTQSIGIVLDRILPVPRESATLKDIVKFKRKRKDELMKFRVVLTNFADTLSQANSIEEVEEVVHDCKTALRVSVNELRRVFDDERFQYFLTSMKSIIQVKSPAFLATMASFASEYADRIIKEDIISDSSKVLGVLGLGFLQVAGSANKLRIDYLKEKNKSELLYLYHASKDRIVEC